MRRTFFDRLVSVTGLFLAALLIIAGSLLTWAHNFVEHQVHTELAAQQVFFPAKGSPAIAAPAFAPMRQYAGQQLTTGAQAETYANHFIAVHLKQIGGGKTYAQLSTQAQTDPTNTKLAATVNTVFKGETLRGLLLNAYAFGTAGMIAGVAAIVTFGAAAVMLVLSGLGLWHSRRTSTTQLLGSNPPHRPLTTTASVQTGDAPHSEPEPALASVGATVPPARVAPNGAAKPTS